MDTPICLQHVNFRGVSFKKHPVSQAKVIAGSTELPQSELGEPDNLSVTRPKADI